MDEQIKNQLDVSSKTLIDEFKNTRPLILKYAGNVKALSKADGSPITDIDIEVERVFKKSLENVAPNIPVFGEESGYDENNLPDICWIIDPIDGTKSFVAGEPFFTNMGVLIVNNEAVFSVIYNPITNDLYVAQKNHGATKNGHTLNLKNIPLPNKAWCKGKHIESLNKIIQGKSVTCAIAPEGGGHGFAMVAEGSIAARFQLHSRGGIHDYAPGALLVKEAGGDIIPVLSSSYNYKSKCFVACHPKISSLIRSNSKLIKKLELENSNPQI